MLYSISEHTGIFVCLDFVQYSSCDKKLDTQIIIEIKNFFLLMMFQLVLVSIIFAAIKFVYFHYFARRTSTTTGWQGMLPAPRHQITPLVYPEVRAICPILWIVFPTGLVRSMMIRYSSELRYQKNVFQSKQLCHLLKRGHWTLLGVKAKVIVTPNVVYFASTSCSE